MTTISRHFLIPRSVITPALITTVLLLAGCTTAPGGTRIVTSAAPAGATAEVRAAVLDYVDALYEVRPELIERSVHPSLTKIGFYRGNSSAPYEKLEMTYDELRTLAGRWNRDGQVNARTAAKEIVVYDVLDQTATAKLTADWGTDYLQLAKFNGRWQIVLVLWQSPV
jgi:hypothetical protein